MMLLVDKPHTDSPANVDAAVQVKKDLPGAFSRNFS